MDKQLEPYITTKTADCGTDICVTVAFNMPEASNMKESAYRALVDKTYKIQCTATDNNQMAGQVKQSSTKTLEIYWATFAPYYTA